MIDVIIPAYMPDARYLPLLQRALKSLEKQTYKNFSVKVVLNGCYTSQKNITDSLKYTGDIDFFEIKERIYGGAAKNLIIKNSKKKYIASLDADDQFYPLKLEKQIKFLEENTDVDILGTLYNILYKDEILPAPYGHGQFEKNESIKSIIEKVNIMCHGSIVFRSSMFKKYNLYYDENYKDNTIWPAYGKLMWGDWDYWIRLSKTDAVFHNLQERLYLWTDGTSVG